MRVPTLTCLIAVLLSAGPSSGLERAATRLDRDPGDAADDWTASGTEVCTVAYANTCTGWLWVWSNWEPGETFGVVFEPCCGGNTQQVVASQVYFWTGVTTGYGYTGTLAISSVGSADCPGIIYDAYSVVPTQGAVEAHWQGPVPEGPVVVTFTHGSASDSDAGIPTDHPAAGPTGPTACGLCYPSTRPTRTFRFGTPSAPLCPGEPLNDGVCNAEALFWTVTYACFHGTPDAVESSTWGSIKDLYR
jgi:hypothetical protein